MTRGNLGRARRDRSVHGRSDKCSEEAEDELATLGFLSKRSRRDIVAKRRPPANRHDSLDPLGGFSSMQVALPQQMDGGAVAGNQLYESFYNL